LIFYIYIYRWAIFSFNFKATVLIHAKDLTGTKFRQEIVLEA